MNAKIVKKPDSTRKLGVSIKLAPGIKECIENFINFTFSDIYNKRIIQNEDTDYRSGKDGEILLRPSI